MSKFKMYDDKYRHLMGTALKTIEKLSGKVAKSDIAMHDRWPHEPGSYTMIQIHWAVYNSPDAEEWQRFRVSLKGLSTQEKLYCLAWRQVEERPHDKLVLERIRVDNYIGALVRGGQLNSKLEVVR